MVGRQDKGKMSSKRDRYWSVMLVGDHGRVIPFRHFKGIVITLCTVFLLILTAFIVVAFFYARQIKTISALELQIAEAELQNSRLRDEKDLYLTKLTLEESRKKNQSEDAVSPGPTIKKPASPAVIEKTQKTSPLQQDAETTAAKKQAAVKKQAPRIQPMAQIRNFSAKYDNRNQTLRVQFRIYNTSKPKKPLAGKSAVVFKHLDDPTVKWLPVPAVQLNAGKPTGDKGQAFQIRNYLTMKFRAYGQKPPVQYNSVTAYVFSDDGRLLTSKDFAVNIDVPLPVRNKPAKTSPRPREAKSSEPPQSTEASSPKPVEPALPNPKNEGQPATPPDSQDVAPAKGPAPEANPPNDQDTANPDAADILPDTKGLQAAPPTAHEPMKGANPQAPASSTVDRPSSSSKPEKTPGYDGQKPPLETVEPTEAVIKPKIEGETR
jgi:hypothetical protein